jgi:hypothetical protein
MEQPPQAHWMLYDKAQQPVLDYIIYLFSLNRMLHSAPSCNTKTRQIKSEELCDHGMNRFSISEIVLV